MASAPGSKNFHMAFRLPERLRSPELQPLGSRIRRRLALDYASRDELLACLDHLLVAADRELPRLDEKLFLELYAQSPKPKPAPAARKR